MRAALALEAALKSRGEDCRICLELYAGSGRWSHALARRGFYVLMIDLKFGSGHDLDNAKVMNFFLGMVQGRRILVVLAGFPCQSFSAARNRPGGPPPLRNAAFVQGLPGLRPHDERKVQRGNRSVGFVCRLVRACVISHVPAALENPKSSWAWQMPAMLELLTLRQVRRWHVDFCQYGTAWKKATTFVTVGCDSGRVERSCCPPRPGVCSRTGCRHQRLEGVREDGVFWTHVAEAYPRKLAEALAMMFHNAVLASRAAALDAYFWKPVVF